MLIVKTKNELKEAKKNKVKQFIVIGELAEKLNKAQKISRLSRIAVAALAGTIGIGVATAPVTGGTSVGVSALVATGAAASAGVPTSVTLACIACGGIAIVYGLYKEYNVRVRANVNGSIELEFTRK